MEQTECVVLKSGYPTGNFFKFEKAFGEQLKEIADEKGIQFSYVAQIHLAHFDIVMKCGVDHAEALVSATRQALQKLNRTPSAEGVDIQTKQVLQDGILALNGEEKLLIFPMPDHVLFAGIAAAHRGR